MAGKSGKVVSLWVSDGSSPPNFVKVGGARNHGVDLNPGFVDDSDKDSGGWSSVGPYGLKSIKVTMAGVYKGSVGELIVINHIAQLMTDDTPTPLAIELREEGIGTWAFNGYIKRDIDAPHDSIMGQTLTIDNQGEAIFTAESPQS